MQQEVKDKEAHLEQCYLRMERGEPPDETIEMEWQKIVRQDIQSKKEKEQQRMVRLVLGLFLLLCDFFPLAHQDF